MSWLDVIIQPSSFLRNAEGDERTMFALALLVENRLDEYERVAATIAMPSLAALDTAEGGPAVAIARGLLYHRRGDPRGVRGLQEVIANDDYQPEIRLVSAILLGMALSDLGRPDVALPVLAQALEFATSNAERALVYIHGGLRQIESGNAELAYQATADAIRYSERRKDPASRTLAVVASRNLLNFAFAARKSIPETRYPAVTSPSIGWIEALAREGLGAYLAEHFKGFFQNPYSRTLSFRQRDEADDSLLQALLRAQALGYFQLVRQLRQALGQYRLLQSAGKPGLGAASGFELLRRTPDPAAISSATAIFRLSGPLEVLKAVGEAAISASWLLPEVGADLSLIAGCASSLSVEAAAAASDRLMSAIDDLISKPTMGGWETSNAFTCLASLLPLLDDARADAVSRALRAIAEQPPDAMTHQSMTRAIHALGFSRLDAREVAAWRDYTAKHLSVADDHIFPAIAAAAELLASGDPRVKRNVVAAYRHTHSLWLAGLMIEIESAPGEARILRDSVRNASQHIREEASAGRYGISGLHVGDLLGRLAVKYRDHALRREALALVMDPRSPVEERVAAAQVLLAHVAVLPQWMRRRLGGGIPVPSVDLSLLGSPGEIAAVNLQLEFTLGALSAGAVMSQLLSLSASTDPEERVLAAMVARDMASSIDERFLATFVLQLSEDVQPTVRGQAGNALARVHFADPSLEELRIRRLEALVSDPGEVVPVLVWQGIATSARANRPVPSSLRDRAQVAARDHISHWVREAARGASR
jgi:tetratricopeptide (TPR) repeat protein